MALAPGPLALVAAGDEAAAVAAWLAETAPGRALWIDDGRLDVGLAMVPLQAASPVVPPGRSDAGPAAVDRFLVLGPAPDGGRAVDLDAVVSALLAGGLPGRQIADALRPLGVRRGDLYRVADRLGADPGPGAGELAGPGTAGPGTGEPGTGEDGTGDDG